MQGVYHRPAKEGGRCGGVLRTLRRLLWVVLGILAVAGPARAEGGFVGLEVQGAEGPARKALGQEGFGGVLVRNVLPNGPADAAGLRPGDLLTTFDGVALSGLQQLVGYMAGTRPGQGVGVDVWRHGRREAHRLSLGPWPEGWRVETEATAVVPALGLTVRALTPEVRAAHRVPWGRVGVVAAAVVADGPAAEAGLRVGDVVVAVGRRRVVDPAAMVAAVAAQGENWMLLVDGGDAVRLAGPGAPPADAMIAGEGVLAVALADGPYVLDTALDGPAVAPGATLPVLPEPAALPDPAQSHLADLGLTVAALSAEARARWSLRWSSRGAVVTQVVAGSAAMAAGLAPGQVIRQVNQVPVEGPAHLAARVAAAPAPQVLLVVDTAGARRLTTLRRDGTVPGAPAATPVFQFGDPD